MFLKKSHSLFDIACFIQTLKTFCSLLLLNVTSHLLFVRLDHISSLKFLSLSLTLTSFFCFTHTYMK